MNQTQVKWADNSAGGVMQRKTRGWVALVNANSRIVSPPHPHCNHPINHHLLKPEYPFLIPSCASNCRPAATQGWEPLFSCMGWDLGHACRAGCPKHLFANINPVKRQTQTSVFILYHNLEEKTSRQWGYCCPAVTTEQQTGNVSQQ